MIIRLPSLSFFLIYAVTLLVYLAECSFGASRTSSVNGKKILVVYSHDEHSHILSMLPYLKRLRDDGHQLTVFETKSESPKPADLGPGIKIVSLYVPAPEGIYETLKRFMWEGNDRAYVLPFVFYVQNYALGLLYAEYNKTFHEILEEPFDLVIADDLFAVHGFAIATYKKRKYSKNPSARLQIYHHQEDEEDLKRPYVPELFFDRLAAFLYENLQLIGIAYLGPYFFTHIPKLGVEGFSWEEYYANNGYFLSDAIDNLGKPNPEGVDLIHVGSHCSPPVELTGELLEFVERAKNGVLYIAMGSLADWNYAPQHVIEAFNYALNDLKEYRVIFSHKSKNRFKKFGDHVKEVTWAPQHAILSHPNTKAFITHGGLKSWKEGICSETPLIVFALFAEQVHNARFTNDLGNGRRINKHTVTGPHLAEIIRDVMKSPHYLERAKDIKALYLDRPIPSLDLASFITRRVLEGKDNPRFIQRKGQLNSWSTFLYLPELFVVLFAIQIVCIK